MKREQLILAVCVPVVHLLRRRRTALRHTKLSLALAVLSGLGCMAAMAVTHGELLNLDAVAPATGRPFAMSNFLVLGPKYLSHVFDTGAYNILAPVTVIALLSASRRREAFALFVFASVHAVMFCSFMQTYFFETYGEIPWFHFQRYTLAIAPCFALLFGLGLQTLREATAKLLRSQTAGDWVNSGLASLWLGTSLYSGICLRESLAQEEENVRVQPTLEVCRLTGTRAWIVTDTPLLHALLCSPEYRIVALPELGIKILRSDLEQRMRSERIFFHQQRTEDRQRYPEAYEVLSAFKQIPVADGTGYRLFELTLADDF